MKPICVMASGATSLGANLPEIALGVTKRPHRLVHLHQNVPGVLADIGSEYSDHVLAELAAMPVTIRLRTLRTP
jgi:hypothetical protein